MSTSSSLVDILRARAAETPERHGYIFLDADGRETESLRFGELDLRARTIARALQEEGAGRGERALLLYPPGLEFVAAFFGCLYAGIVAVPVYPPRLNRSQERLRTVAADCEARLVLAPASIAVHARNLGQQVPLLAAARWLTTDLLPSELAGAWTPPPIAGSDLAFLQYTSGSTATPKGVMVTHGNLLHNEEMIRRSFGQTEESVVVGWLPLYHDMGLIGNVLQPLCSGGQAILMSPMTFLQRPAVWLETLSRYRGTTSGGPNFAYDLCVRKVGQEQRERLDLSCWTVAFNGAEPVRAETMRRFREAFAPCGFRPQAFFPCYGLAEATLFVTGGGPEEPPVVRAFEGEALERSQAVEAAGTAAARELVGCGRSAEDQRVAIVDPASGEPCPAGDVGEIWVRGPSVAAGYWNQPEESARVFQARLGGQGGPFLRTGDLGFLLGSELFVTGRLKDLIILRGRNHYPQDIEQTVERSHPALRPGCGAAFSVEGSDGEERLIVLQEVERRPSEPVDFTVLAETVQRAVSEEHDASVAETVLLRAGTILKTSSGKIRRRACRAAYLAGELEIVARSVSTAVEEASAAEPGDGVQGFLVRCAAEILKTSPDRVSPQVPLPALGLDSLAAAELRSRVEERYGAALSLAWLLEGATLAEVSAKIPLLAAGEPPALPPSAPASEHGEGRPLSSNQRALWIADRLSPASAAYNLAGAARIRGRLDPAALARAFQILVDRHAALRTAFVVRAEDPLQTVLDRVEADFRVERVAPEDAAALEQRLDAEAFRPFDLESGSLMRVRIWSLGEEEHRLLMVLHHLVSDFASIAVLLHELSQLYRQETGGPAVPLAPPGRLYSDHLWLQERELAGPRSEELRSYWKSQLAGRIPALDLATDRPRPPLQTYAGGTRTIRLGAALSADLVALGLRHQATLYMTLLAGFHTLLQRYGQGELAIGAPTAGRSAAGFERVVGYFVNPVALRLDAAGDLSFAELLNRTRKVAIEAFEHQGLPFGWLTERLRLDRDPSRSPLFQTLFVLHRTREPEERALAAFALGLDAEAFELGDLRLESMSLGEGRVPYDLTLSAAHRGEEEGIAASLQYNRDLFDGASAERMLGHLANLLRSALSDPERRIAELALLSEAERRQLLEPWNLPRQLLPEPLSAQRDFELQAARIPDAVAVVGSGEALTYGELDSKANRLARYLIAHGVGTDVLVAIALDRTPSLVAALLGVLKSGGAYVPLDPRHPRQRLARILEDARPAVVITEEGLLPALPTAETVFLCLDREWSAIERQSGEPFDAAVGGEGLAYVIFTSGSTGQPKGVQIPHRALVNFLRSMSRRPGLGEEDVLLAVTTVSFDIAALELLLPLSVGARVELATPEEAMDPVRLQARLSASGATVLQSTPATWTMLLEAGWEGNRLLTAFCGGEALSAGLACDLLPRVRSLWNLYGPTETTVWSAAREVSQGEAPVLVGGPIANTWLYLLGRWQEPVPFGVPGELYIGGTGLARGYLGRPDLTAEQFVPDPFAGAGEPGVRMYRVGDLARRRPDGLIEFLGRTDHQVKIRGFRIELGEVERALAACTGVRQAVAAVREDASGAARLVAYAVPEPGERPTLAGLRSAMGTSLPDYMLPAALVLLEALPLNPSGKVDRRALPAPGPERETETGMGTAPLSPTEELLAGIWGELLGIGRMGRDESFFDLGGNSLLATRVVSRVRQILRVELPLRSLFEAPTLAGLAARIEEGLKSPGRSAPRIVPVPREGDLPLSFAQQRLWFLDQLAPGSAAYNMPFAVRLEGELDLPAFAAALSEVVRRQESLRTVFPSVEGRPVQAVLPAAPVFPGAVDLAGLPGDLAGREAERLLVEEAARPFDLARGPLLRLRLLRLSPTGHLALVSLHHIIGDGWSLEVLFREVAALYGALREHRPSPLAELPVQYADFAVWQREWLRGEVLEEQLGAWRRLLADLPPQLDLPTDRARPARSSSRGGVRTVDLGEELSRDLLALSRRCGATLFMTLLAGFQALLGRVSGRDDVPVGSPIANRNRWETEGLIGFFVNTLVLRGDLSGAPSFRELLARTRETTLEAYAHQDLPFEKLVEELAPERDLSASPLFQVFFVLQNDPPARLALPGLRVEPVPVRSQAAQFSLSLDLTATHRGLAGTFEHSLDLFDGTTIARWAGHLGNWLRAAVAEPERRISGLPLLGEGERQQVLREWNENRVQPPQSPSIVRMFERRVDLAPEAPALFHAGRRLTYGELDRWSNRLAHRLLRLGVGPEVRVAVLAERSPELFVGMFGILKAGGAYVPLDAAYPKDRLAFMLEDSAAAVLLTQERLADRLSEHAPITVLLDAPGLEEESPERPARDVGSDHLAYVIYTSGSTGRPKGTMVSHQALASYTETVLPVYGVVPGDRVLQFCSVSFDISLEEIVPCLTGGAELVLRTEAMLESVSVFLETCRRWSVTMMSLPTAYWHEIVAKLDTDGLILPASLRLVVIAGERALPERLAAWRRHAPRRPHLINTYGLTESTIISTIGHLSSPSLAEAQGEVSVGRVIPDTEIHLFDAEAGPVPIGVAGELHIGGGLLARGYLNRPEVTAERFVPHPFSDLPGARLYRTGDLARALPDGELVFLGRGDRQVKVRGYRIELEEIEARLLRHQEVESALVTVREDLPGDKQIVGYLVFRQPPGPGPAELRAFLRETLPDYMVPGAFVTLDAVPLTPNGKVDHGSLPAPALPSGGESGLETLTPVEGIVAGIWSDVLGLPRIGAADHFFALGGHSLLATQAVSRLQRTFGIELPLRRLFEAPTVAELARAVEEIRSGGASRPAPRIVPAPREGELPLSFAQQRLWFLDQLAPGGAAYNMPFAVRLEGEQDLPAFAAALSELVRRQESLRTVFPSVEGRPVQAVLPAAPVFPGVVDLAGLPGDLAGREAERLVAEESARPFDLASGPLLRLHLLRLSPTGHLILATLHHIIGDGWSVEVLVREVAALYGAFRQRRSSPLAELPVQYADFAAWQREWLRGEVLEEQLGAWRRLLAGLPAQLDLPTDRPRPVRSTSRGGVRRVDLGEELSRDLLALSRRCGATLFMTLLAGFQALLGRISRRDDIPVGSPIANRNRWETEGLIGFFVNTLVLRGDLSGAPSFRELLSRTRETTLEAYAHQDLPFEKLVEELAPERNLSASPLFQVLFVLQNAPSGQLALPGLLLEPVPIPSRVAKFSLDLELMESEAGLTGTFEYSRDLFDGTTIARWVGHLGNWLRAAVADPDRRISELPLLGEGERQQVLREWNENGVQPPRSPSIVGMFERRVDLAPEAPALFHAGRRLTYGELDRWSNRLAHRLLRLGVGPEARVAVLAERSPELIVGMLGILKAGGVYVPLDASYPKDRLSFMLEDSAAAVLLTQVRLADRVPEHAPITLLLDASGLEEESPERPAHDCGGDHLAYVIYTSGSTGRPKGSMVSHRALASYTETVLPIYGVVPGERVLQFCSVSFDISLEEIVPCLTGGAELVLRTEAMLESVSVFLETCRRWSVTMMSLPTAYWHEIVAKLDTDGLILPASLRLVVIAGERALPERLAAWRRHAPRRPHLINTYGLTESTIVSTVGHLGSPSLAEAQGEVSVGRVIPDTEIHLFDAEGEPVPIGVAGELYIGGGLLARGYLNRPDVTAERFVPHPSSDLPGARLYRTGDLARALADGELVFVGRGDRQVKVRGYRIELEEIEARLLRHPEVESALVTVREDRPGDKQVVGYLVFRRPPGPGQAELRAFLREALPDYMVPGAFVTLDAVPLTPNGKVDRGSLPAPAPTIGQERGLRTPVEQLVAEVWADVLGLRQVGPDDNFFALGGHSLLVTQVAFRLQRVFGIEVQLRSLFEAPTVAALAARVEEAWRRSPAPSASPLVPRPRGGDLPLSFAQQRLWLIDQLEPGSPAYNLPAALRLRGRLAVPALAAALGEIVRRHEVLRTVFRAMDGEPLQIVAPPLPVPLPVIDLSGLPTAEREAERRIGAEASRPFDLARGPLVRFGLLRLGPEDHIAVLNMHHIVSDGWSGNVLIRELTALYGALLAGEPSPLAELPIQYADFAFWQRDWLQGEDLESELAYWREQLRGAPPVLELPTDRPRPAVQGTRGGERSLSLPSELAAELAGLARREAATPFMVLLAAFQTLLHRYSGKDDISVGTPVAGRNRVETEKLIGFFVNTLVLRGDLAQDPDFLQLLARLRDVTLQAYRHQDLPFEKLVEELRPERSLSHTPLFQVMLALQNGIQDELELPGVQLMVLGVETGVAKFDLLLELGEGPTGLAGTLQYRKDLFDAPTAQRLIGHFQQLLWSAVETPDGRLSELELLSEAERHQLLQWNATEVSYRAPHCLHELILEQTARAPDAIAVVDEQKSLSYGELAAQSARLARHLQTLGVGPEVRVGICLERSVEMVVGLLGILSAGGAYVPLDPSYPLERLLYMLEDSAVEILLVRGSEAAVRPDLVGGRRLVDLDRLLDLPPSALAGGGRSALPDNLAYVIYTSGSTGRPKGAMNTHRGIVNRLLWMQSQYGITPEDRVLQKTPFSFDVSVWELFWPLLQGARLVMARPGGHQDGGYLVRTIHEQGITTVHFVPSMLGIFLETPGVEQCTSLRRVIASGEALPHALQQRHFSRLGAPLHNLYGPTEAAVDVTWWACDPADPRGLVPIGRPVANTAIHLLDPYLYPVPVGVAGQLCIGGVQLARGYLGRPDLTAEKFLPDPQGPAGARIYATGDLARRLPAGEIDYLGRIDHQVKVRGFRIELGEIESVLAAHPGVREAVVVARSETTGARLVAYVAADAAANRGELVNGLRRSCREALPEAMMPSAFVVLDALPLTPNGKVDRRALPAPPSSGPAESPGPRTPVEEIVAAIWSEVLGVERVGVEDSFFDLGGHSLLANQVVSRLREAFRVELPLRDFFAAPTVKDLTRWIETAGKDGASLAAPPLVARPRRDDGEPMSFAQQRLWFLHQLDPESTAYHVPIAVRLEGALVPEALESALAGVVRRHEALRTTFALRADGPVQVIAPVTAWKLPVMDLSGLGAAQREAEMQRLAQEEVSRPFDLTRGPLLRTALVRLGASGSVLLAVMHHIVSDAWSMAVLWREMVALYRSAVERRPADLPELPIQYSDFAQWQRELLSGEVLEAQLSYWRRHLAGAPTLLELPTDRPRPRVQRFRGGRQGFSLPAETTRRLQELSRREGATLFMTLLAAFDALLHRYSRQEDVVVGFPIAGRNRVETEGLIGLFINTLALRAAVPGASSWLALLRQVRKVSLAGYAHQDLPFEKLVAELDVERSLAHAPLFQTLLVMQNIPALGVAVPDLTIEPLDLGTGTAKFDLVLNMEETAGGLSGRWLYNSELFEAATVARMSGHFAALLTGILADPGQRVEDLPLLGAAERQQMVVGWNDTAAELPLERTFQELFETVAERAPASLAVVSGPHRISYGELNARANRLARSLLAAGVVREDLVAVLAERGADLLVAMLALFKAGGVYLPLDPHHPAQRLLQTIEQSASRLVLVSDAFRDTASLLATEERKVLALSELLAREQPAENFTCRSDPGQLAYVLFTSGSTGAPKGVMIPQRGMVNHLWAKIYALGLSERDRVAETALQTFDISIWQFLAALLVGGSVHILSDEVVHDPLRLLDEIEDQDITVFETVPSLLSALLQVDERFRPRLASLRWLIPTGEALPPELCREWLDAYPDIPLVNAYGPTECSDDVTHQILREPLAQGTMRTPIGSPVLNTRIYVVEPGGDPAPVGVPGELAVGGVQVGRGYWGRPDLTAERFVPDAFGAEPGARLYRTGDLARWRDTGEVEFLGRIDHQVKVRGFRIELGDIEAALLSHPAVREAVVLARAQPSGALDQRLVAYWVAEEGEEIALADLRTFLQKSLPEYMVPSAFVSLERLPLTANGKVDRKALPAPETDAAAGPQGFVAPRTDLERSLCELWAEVLGLAPEQVGVQDSFFEIGGDSIRGAILINRLQKKLGQIVHVVALFDHPTVAELATYLTSDYPEAVAGLWGLEVRREAASAGRIGTAQVALLRGIIPPLSPAPAPEARNPPAVFVLSAPRSGSTLLRVMLGGHPRLFAPPELELLSFTDMAERRAAFSGRNAFWLEGLLRTVMEALHCSADEAKALVERCEDEGLPTRLVYRRLQQWIGPRMLVDKTPSYALSRDALERAETDFDGARYIHLIRHPNAVIHSFEETRLDQVFFRHAHPFTRRELAELIWTVSHQNIVDFLTPVPLERQHWVRFEELVRDPVAVLSGLCEFLGIDFHPDMAKPYKETAARMTDGLHAQSRMLGDVKFHQHADVEAGAAERWRQQARVVDLGEPTHQLASLLGYETRPAEEASPRALPPLVPADRSRPLPLSFAQQRLWFLDQLSPGGSAYNIPASIRLVGRLDVPALAASLGEVVRRHETLRTTFGKEAGEPVQRIAASAPIALPVIDLRGLPAPARELEACSLAGAEAERAFDLARGPLLRAHLVALAGEEQVILLTMHHIVSDGWSQGVLVQELASLYEAFSQGRPSPLPELPIQYADFACWQRQWLAGEVLDAEIAYWRERLAGAPPRLELPTDRPRPAVQTFAGANCDVSIPAPAVAGLKAVARSQDATLFMALVAAFQALLCRYSGQTDVSVGTPIAGRNHFETEKLIGFFVNTLVLRTELSGEPAFSELTARVRETALAAYLHQGLPFEMLVEQLRPERSLSHSPLFQVMLALQNAPQGALTVPGLQFEPFEVPGTAAKFDLTLTLVEAPNGLQGTLSYNRDLFEEATVRRLAQSWIRLVQAAVAEPESRVLELPLLAPAERDELVAGFNSTARDYPPGLTLHELIEAQARRSPEAIAVSADTDGVEIPPLTYRELDRQANQLARFLRSLGVAADSLVGVCMERSLEMVVALVGILKAGGAYVPLDPGYPAERLAYMLEDAGAPVLLTQSHLAQRLPARGARIVALDTGWPEIAAFPAESLRAEVTERHLAYVIYTSGSTGRPKGAMLPHSGICNRLLWMQDAYGLTPEDRVLQKTPFSFDVSVWEFFWPLITGARLVMARPGGHQDPFYLVSVITRERITTLHFVPSMLQIFLEQPGLSACDRVRRVICSGEALPDALRRRFHERMQAELHNLYGPTEASVDVTFWPCEADSALTWVPIGRPIANTQIYLLDPRFHLVALGVAGELCIGGVSLARGYLRRPGLTAERFVPDPFGGAPGGRLYRTGDLARLHPDGAIEYLGRIDHQVKIRGFRIELGEIESVLAQLPGVREAVVLAREGPQGEGRLAAWIVTGEGPLAPDDLRQRLRARLPEHMVPADFSFLESLPLTPNGKVDRRALPAPDPVRTGSSPAAPPRDEVEHRLAEIWAEILGLESVGVNQSFFELGGHSLSAVRLMARIEDRLGQALPLSAVFQATTVERMASLLRAGAPAITSTRPVVVKLQGGSRRPFFCVHPIGGNVFCYVSLARALGPGQPFYGLQAPDLSSAPAETLDTIEEMSGRYVEAMREVQPTGPYRLGGWSMGAVVAFEMARQLRRAEEEVELVAMLDAPAPGAHRYAGDLDRSSVLADFARDLAGGLLPVAVEELRQLDHERQLAQVLEWAKEAGALPAGESLDRLAGLFATFERNLAALGRYEPGPYPGRIELFRASDTAAHRPDPGWADLAHGGVAIHEIPGDHYSIVRRPELVAGCLKVFLGPGELTHQLRRGEVEGNQDPRPWTTDPARMSA